MSGIIVGLHEDWVWMDEHIESKMGAIKMISRRGESCQRLMSSPSIGQVISATNLVATVTREPIEQGLYFSARLGREEYAP